MIKKNSVNKEPLTKRQNEILIFIKKYIANNGYSPSIREIGLGNNISSSATVHSHLTNLVKKGWIKKSNFKFRTIEIIGENEYLNENNGLVSLPLYYDSNNVDKNNILVSNKLFDINKKSILLKITNEGIFNIGDVLVINNQKKYNLEDIIVYKDNNVIKTAKYQKDLNNIIGKVEYVIKKMK